MGELSASPGTDHAWLAKVLAGDPAVCGVLALARDLPDAEWDAFARSVKKIAAPNQACSISQTPMGDVQC